MATAVLTGTHSSRLATQTATVAQLLDIFEEDPARVRVFCKTCWVQRSAGGSHVCWE